MPVYDQSYAHWKGVLRRPLFRFAPMIRYDVKLLMGRRLVLLLLVSTLIPAVIASFAVYLVSQTGEGPMALLRESGLGGSLAGLSTKAEQYWELSRQGFYFFLLVMQAMIVLVITGVVGSGLISKDVRSNALELYLTKPITAMDYFFGKLSVVAVFIFLVTFVPAMLVFFVASAMWPGYLEAAWPIIGRIALASAISSVVNGMVILGLSSLAKSSRYATTAWFALCFISEGAATALVGATGNLEFMHLGYRNNFAVILDAVFGENLFIGAYEDVLDRVMHSDHTLATPALETSIFVLSGLVALSALILWRTIRSVEHR